MNRVRVVPFLIASPRGIAQEHAVISTVTARHGVDGHRRLSFPAVIAPYAGTTTAIYGWYPSRYDVKDGLRMGNYALLAFVGANTAREFIYGGPHTLFSQLDRPGSMGTASAETASGHGGDKIKL